MHRRGGTCGQTCAGGSLTFVTCWLNIWGDGCADEGEHQPAIHFSLPALKSPVTYVLGHRCVPLASNGRDVVVGGSCLVMGTRPS